MITGIVRTSYAKVWEAAPDLSGNLKFSICLMIPKEDIKAVAEINEAIQGAITKGIEKGRFSKSAVKHLKLPLRDGDAEIADGKRTAEYANMFFINCSSTKAPGIVNMYAKPIMEQEDFYSGCWCRADINFFPFSSAGNKGIGVGLNNLMKVKDDDRLDGRQTANKAFAEFTSDDENDETNESLFNDADGLT